MLAASTIRKLTKFINHVARPTKRLRQPTTGGVLGTPRAKGRMADVDTQMLSRLLKILERGVRAGEDVEPFLHHAVSGSGHGAKSVSPRKPSTKKGGAKAQAPKGDRRSRTPRDEEEHDEGSSEPRASQSTVPSVDDADWEKLAAQLDVAHESILAADCCIALLASDRLTKQARFLLVLSIF
jgi:cohesin loading factor subunit SCC2